MDTTDHRPLNVLLLLSYDQDPPPDEEVLGLKEECETKGGVYFATTRHLGALRSGAEVSFVADGRDAGPVLARAVFQRFVSLESADASAILQQSSIYGTRRPQRMRGVVHLTDVHLLSGASTASLNGWTADGTRLSDSATSDASTYYVKGVKTPTGIEREALLRAKCDELQDKYADVRRLWEQERRVQQRVLAKKFEESRRLIEEGPQPKTKQFSGRGKAVARMWSGIVEALFPRIELLANSAEEWLQNYSKSKLLIKLLSDLSDDPLRLGDRLRQTKPVTGRPGWFEARFGDNLGRLYYRSTGDGRDARVQVLVSQKDRQGRDIEFLKKVRAK